MDIESLPEAVIAGTFESCFGDAFLANLPVKDTFLHLQPSASPRARRRHSLLRGFSRGIPWTRWPVPLDGCVSRLIPQLKL
jgi:hypothetical protein